MKLAIVEDQAEDQKLLCDAVKNYLHSQSIEEEVHLYSNGENFLDVFRKDLFHIIFLDIYLDGIDGMTIAHKIRELDTNCLLVFITCSDAFAVNSFKVRAFHYLLKPYSKESLEEVLTLSVQALADIARFINIKSGRSIIRVLLCDILYADTDRHYVCLHTKNEVIRSRMPFQELSALLLHDFHFLICYRNIIINMNMVETISRNNFILKNGEIIPIQKDKVTQVREAFTDYLFHKTKGEHRI